MKEMYECGECEEFFNEVQDHYREEEKKEDVIPIGLRLKALREKQGMSLEHFSGISGIDQDKVKDIEARRILPDLATIVKLSRAFRMGAEGSVNEPAYSVVRKQECRTIQRVWAGRVNRPNFRYQSLANGCGEETFLVTLAPEAGNAELSRHDGEEFLWVMEGAVKVVVGNRQEVLGEGDSICYPAAIPHNVVNASAKDRALIMAVICNGG